MDKRPTLSIIIPNHKEHRLMSVYGQCKLLYPKAQIILADDIEGRGKGWAMREGLKQAKGDLICFIDGDMDIHPKEIVKLLRYIEHYDIVVGNRVYVSGIPRIICSWTYHRLIKLLFGLSVDTQSGLKLYRRYTLSTWKTDSFAYDIEILAKAKKWGYRIGQVDIDCEIIGSKTKWRFIRAILETFTETVKIWWEVMR